LPATADYDEQFGFGGILDPPSEFKLTVNLPLDADGMMAA